MKSHCDEFVGIFIYANVAFSTAHCLANQSLSMESALGNPDTHWGLVDLVRSGAQSQVVCFNTSLILNEHVNLVNQLMVNG